MSGKIFILDAMNLAYRFFHTPGGGSKPETALKSESGELTGIVYGMARLIRNIYQNERPTHMAVAMESAKSVRKDLFADYKAGRNERPDALAAQLPLVEEFLNTIGIKGVSVDGHEADDVAGSIAVQARNAGMKAAIVSIDKDFFQLVGNGIFVYRNSHNHPVYRLMAEDGALERFGATPDKVIDILSIAGDTADNVPGVRGVGQIGALKLILQFGSLENIYANLDKVTPGLRKKLEASREDAFLSKQLVTIKTDLPVDLDSLRIEGDPLNTMSARDLLARLNIRSI